MFETLEKKLATATVGALCWWSGIASAVNDLPGGPAVHQLNLPPAVTKIAEEQHSLHWMMMIICLGIFVAVFGVMFYSIFKHRKSVGHQPATFHESIKVELAWTIVPFIIVIVMAIPATRTVVAQKDTSNADVTIKATGYQWRWGYEYLTGEGNGINYVSSLDNEHRLISDSGAKGVALDNYLLKVDHPLVVPVNKKVRVIVTGGDVILRSQCRLSVSSRMRSLVLFVTLGSAPRRPAISTVSARSCAARSTLTCRSMSKC